MKKQLKMSLFTLCLFSLLACNSNQNLPNKDGTKENEIKDKIDDKNDPIDNEDEDEEDDTPFVDMELSNEDGLVVKFDNKGAKIDSITFGDLKIAENGFVAGRVANRIANGTFELDGKTYNVTKNNGKHCLHGGNPGFGDLNWTKTKQTAHKIVFELDSADGDQGFPGNIHVSTTYRLSDDGTIDIEYRAVSDAKTLFNPTNHLYMNMNGVSYTSSYSNHSLWIDANTYTKADNDKIPTGEIVSTSGTNLDYQIKKAYVGDNDSNLVLNGEDYRKVAELTGNTSGITCEVYTDRVGLQLYNDNGHICLEAQDFPDAINHSNFPSIVLEAEEEYFSKTSYKFIR